MWGRGGGSGLEGLYPALVPSLAERIGGPDRIEKDFANTIDHSL